MCGECRQAVEGISDLITHGIINSTSPTSFHPENAVPRSSVSVLRLGKTPGAQNSINSPLLELMNGAKGVLFDCRAMTTMFEIQMPPK